MKKKPLYVLLLLLSNFIFSQSKTIDSLKILLEKTSNPKERFNVTNEILIERDKLLLYDIDARYLIQLLKIAQRQKDDGMLATSYNWIGYYFSLSKGDNTTALEYYFKALPLSEKANDKRRISSICFDIGNTYRTFQNDDESIKYIQKGGKNLPDKSSKMYDYMLVQYQRGKSGYFVDKKQLDSASYYAQASEQTAKRLKSKRFLIDAWNLNAKINDLLDENELANVFYKKAVLAIDSSKTQGIRWPFYNNYIPFLYKTNRIQDAKIQTDNFWKQAKVSNNNVAKLLANGFKRELFDKLHQTDSAYYYSRKEAEYDNLIFNQNNLNTIQALAMKEQLRIIEEDAKKSEANEVQKQNLQYIFIAIGILTLIILFLLLSRSFITNTKLIQFFGVFGLLIVFEFLNLLLHPFLEKITHHSPILMLLALVGIAALLVPLHHKVEHWATAKLVEKNKQIRLANAKKTIEKLNVKTENN